MARPHSRRAAPASCAPWAEHTGGEALLLDPHGTPRASARPRRHPGGTSAAGARVGLPVCLALWSAVGTAGRWRRPERAARRSATVLDDGIHAVQVQSLGFHRPAERLAGHPHGLTL
ncbi:hypothetical protein GCM10020220_051070 [Nonomuraea rubra]